jgi:hypothetical protein
MVLEITNSERELLFELIESAHREMIQEIDHTDTREFRKLLQDKLELLEHVGAKIGAVRAEPAIQVLPLPGSGN